MRITKELNWKPRDERIMDAMHDIICEGECQPTDDKHYSYRDLLSAGEVLRNFYFDLRELRAKNEEEE